MPEQSLQNRYGELINHIIQQTLKGNIRSKEQVYQMLVQDIEPDSGDVFETCLADRVTTLERDAKDSSDELKQAKATRSLRAIKTVQGEWERWQTENQARGAIATAVNQILQAEPAERILAFLKVSDPNHLNNLNADQLRQLATTLRQYPVSDPTTQQELSQISEGITRGLTSWEQLQPHLISWMYGSQQMGFGSAAGVRPWELWSKQQIGGLLKSFFETLHQEESVIEWAASRSEVSLADWIEFEIALQTLQRGLVSWAENQAYSAKIGTQLSVSIFLTFGILWSQLANGFQQSTFLNSMNRDRFAEASFRMTIQGLRVFAQRDYFPLYGTFFASFTGAYFRDAMNYLSEPLKRAEGTQEQARILTLLGSTQRVFGAFDAAKEIHTTAKDIAQEAGDRKCEIANLNHLSRIYVNEKNYAEAISYAQRALVLSRQSGDRMGEANALANLGYSEVFQAQQLEADPDRYEMAIAYLEQGLELSDRLGDVQSKALCSISLGSAQVTLNQPEKALPYLEDGIRLAVASGDAYLQAISFAHFAEAFYQLKTYDKAIFCGAISMYQLEQMGSSEWRQTAGLLSILQGQLGDQFQQLLSEQRSRFISEIGVDGYDYLAELLERYRTS
jgi:tetratricopeptide (TPR) repeat protein